ncbi:MAG: DUF2064 domain-containing protein [Bdellovibrionales bacterium]
MSTPSVGLAIFVKTPGVSPLKTRLAKSIGREKAEQFHIDTCKLLQKRFKTLGPNLECYWAVAEAEALDSIHWKDFPRLRQGEGDLGDRLDFVYKSLRKIHDIIVFIGADCPFIQNSDIEKAIQSLEENDFAVAPVEDGGYYLFAGKSDLDKRVWKDVPYSVDTTAYEFIKILKGFGKVSVDFPLYYDIDTIDEYLRFTRG